MTASASSEADLLRTDVSTILRALSGDAEDAAGPGFEAHVAAFQARTATLQRAFAIAALKDEAVGDESADVVRADIEALRIEIAAKDTLLAEHRANLVRWQAEVIDVQRVANANEPGASSSQSQEEQRAVPLAFNMPPLPPRSSAADGEEALVAMLSAAQRTFDAIRHVDGGDAASHQARVEALHAAYEEQWTRVKAAAATLDQGNGSGGGGIATAGAKEERRTLREAVAARNKALKEQMDRLRGLLSTTQTMAGMAGL